MTSNVLLIDLFKQNSIKPHGLIDMRAVLAKLSHLHVEPETALRELVTNPKLSEWHVYGVQGLRILAARGRLSKCDARLLLKMTDRLAAWLGSDEYYTTVSFLAASRKTAPIVLDFAKEKLRKKDVDDWRWLAFFATASVFRKQTAEIPVDLLTHLNEEAFNEPDRCRREQMIEVTRTLPGISWDILREFEDDVCFVTVGHPVSQITGLNELYNGRGATVALCLISSKLGTPMSELLRVTHWFNLPKECKTQNIIVLGGGRHNNAFEELQAKLDLPFKFDNGEVPGGGESRRIIGPNGYPELRPRVGTDGTLDEDYCIVAKAPNPLNPYSSVLLLTGMHTQGTLAAARFVTSPRLARMAEGVITHKAFEIILQVEMKKVERDGLVLSEPTDPKVFDAIRLSN